MIVSKITLMNRSVCYTTTDKVDAMVAAMQRAPQTVFKCGNDVFKASSISGIESVTLDDNDLPLHIKQSLQGLPGPKNKDRELPTATIYLGLDGERLKIRPRSGNYVMAECHYREKDGQREFLTQKYQVKRWVVCSIDEDGQSVVMESYSYGQPQF